MPKVYDDKIVNDNQSNGLTGINKATGQNVDTEAKNTSKKNIDGDIQDLENAYNGPSANEDRNTVGEESGFYNPNNSSEKVNFFQKIKGTVQGNPKKSAGLGLGIAGIGAISILGLSSLGPLQFIHFSQMLQSFHFSSQESNTNHRLGKLLRYMRTKDYTHTKLGTIESRISTNVDKDMAKNGWNFDTKGGNYKGFTYDPPKEQFKNNKEKTKHLKSVEQKLVNDGVPKEKITLRDGKLTIDRASFFKRSTNKKIIGAVYGENRDVGKLTAAIEKRTLIKRAGISLNPLTRVDDKIRAKQFEVAGKIKDYLSKKLKGKSPPDISATGTKSADNADQPARDKAATTDKEAIAGNETSSKLKTGAKVSSAALLSVGFLCIVDAMTKDIDGVRAINAQVPLIEAASTIISVGSKVQDGKDVDMTVLGEYNKLLNSKTKDNKSSFTGAASINYEQGKNAGTKLPDELNPNPDPSAVTELLSNIPGLDTACKVINSTAGQVVQIGIGLVTQTATTVITYLGQSFINNAISKIEAMFIGDIVDLSDPKYAGAVFGEAANVGGRIMANESSAAEGGRPLTNSEEIAINTQTKLEKMQNDSNRSIASKYLSPSNYDTPVAKVIDNIHPDQSLQSVASMPKSIVNTLFSTLSKKAGAADNISPRDAYYGIPKVGFTESSLNAAENPYDNADEALGILQKDPSLGERLKKCNKIEVSGVDSNELDFKSLEGSSDSPQLMGTKFADDKECNNDNNADFVKVRIAALDTITMKSFACVEYNDEESCNDISPDTNTKQDSSCPTDGTSGSTAEPPNDYSKIQIDGKTVNKRTKYMLDEAQKNFGSKLSILQGSYNKGGVAASAGTHDGGGVVDLSTSGMNQSKIDKQVESLRKAGFAAWFRTCPEFCGNEHIHAVGIGDKEMAGGAAAQVKNFFDGSNGLAGSAKDNSPTGLTVTPAWAFKFSKGKNPPADSQCSSSSPGVYKDPLRDVKKKNKERVDPGVDYYLEPGNKVYALGNAKVLQADNSWPNGWGFISYKLLDGKAKGLNVYFAENCKPKVKKGDVITADTVICTTYGTGQVETGWAAQGEGVKSSEASREKGCTVYGHEDPFGNNFNEFLKSNSFFEGVHTADKISCSLPSIYPSWK